MAEKPAPLVPVEYREEIFQGDTIPVALLEVEGEPDPQPFVSAREICENIGISWSPQRRHLLEDPVLARHVEYVTVTDTKSRGNPRKLYLHLDYVPGFLFKVNLKRIKEDDARTRLEQYQEHCYRVLSRAIRSEYQQNAMQVAESRAVREEIAELGRAVASVGEGLARLSEAQIDEREQIDISIEATNTRLDRAGVVFNQLANELAELRSRVGLDRVLTPEQAENVKGRVHEVSGLLRRIPGYGGRKNPHASIWAAIYRDFGVPTYRELRIRQYADVIRWLDDHHRELLNVLEVGGQPTGLLGSAVPKAREDLDRDGNTRND